jgi:signal transduction histidine kinase
MDDAHHSCCQNSRLLIDVTSHELRQPVSAILNCSALVRADIGELIRQIRDHISGKAAFSPTKDQLHSLDEDLEALDAIYQVMPYRFWQV